MRILHIAFGYRPFRGGGLIQYVDDVMQKQVERGHSVAYFCSGRHYPFIKSKLVVREINNHKIFEIISSAICHLGELGTIPVNLEIEEPATEKYFYDVLQSFQPEIIHFHELAGLPSSLVQIAHRLKIPTIYTIHDYYLLCPTLKLYRNDKNICTDDDPSRNCIECCQQGVDGKRRLYLRTLAFHFESRYPVVRHTLDSLKNKILPRLLHIKQHVKASDESHVLVQQYRKRRKAMLDVFSLFDAVISQSDGAKKVYESFAPRRDTQVLHSSLIHIDNISFSCLPDIPKKIKFITLNGFASYEKGGDLLLDALDILNNEVPAEAFSLHVYGSVASSYLNRLLTFPSVKIKGSYDPLELNRILEGYHVGIIPSVWNEIYGYVGLEMLAKGIPVIGNDRGGITDYVKEGHTGWINRSIGAAELAEIMLNIMQNPTQITELNRAIQESYSKIFVKFDSYIDTIIGLYEKILSSSKGK